MKNRIFTLLLTLFFVQGLTAQVRTCNSHDYLLQQLEKNAERATKLAEIEAHTQAIINNPLMESAVNGVITIPVVVHVVYGNAAQNISNAQIQSQIDVLNEDFRRLNGDANNTWSQASDSEVEFCMATIDPNGNPTTGITRTSTNGNPFTDDDKVKFTNQGGRNAWDASSYLNIWVCELDGFLGYAQFPGGPANTDGVVCEAKYFGTTGTATAPFNLGRTGTHEVGHYLNLRHIWGDGGCNVDDLVNDTPTSDAPNYGCANGHTSCGTPDMIENYMDYSDDGCMNLFTTGQKNRMRALFDTGGARASLLNSTACGGSAPTCDAPSGINANSIAATSATASWSVAANAQNYDLQYRISGATTWTTQSNINGTSYGLSGLTNCSTYQIRVRTSCSTGNSAYTSIATFTTTGCAIPCNAPSGLAANNVTNNAATITWNAVADAQNYDVEYRVTGTTAWTTQSNITGTFSTLSNLTNCSDYQVRVRTSCSAANSAYSTIAFFSTIGCATPCNSPTGLAANNVTNNAATITWSAAADAQNYDVQYRVTGTTTWTTQSNINGTSSTLSNLTNCSDYQVRVRTSCASANSAYSAIATFSTSGCSTTCPNNEVTLTIVPDNYGSETTWEVKDGNTVLYSGGPYTDSDNTPEVVDLCLENGCFDFVIYDAYGDGICCAWGNGSYNLTDSDGNILAAGGEFGNRETKNFCIGGSGTVTGDAGVTTIIRPAANNCGGTISPRVRIKNFDSSPLTSVQINYNVDGGVNQSFAWTGTIAAGGTKNINLPTINTTTGAHVFEASTSQPNGGNDANENNDSKSKNFNATEGEQVKIQIKPDDYGSEITWVLEDDNGNIVVEGGPYANNNNTVKTKSVCLENGCYTFTIFDEYGDGICCNYGSGWYRVRNAANQNIIRGNGQYGSFESQSFCIGGNQRGELVESDEQKNPTLTVAPNPTRGKITVIVENAKENSEIKIYNTLGKMVKTILVNSANESQRMDLSNLPDGMYFVKLDDGRKAITKKLIIANR